MTEGADMRAFSASEAACYLWPEDTGEHKALRAAYIQGAADYTLKHMGQPQEGWREGLEFIYDILIHLPPNQHLGINAGPALDKIDELLSAAPQAGCAKKMVSEAAVALLNAANVLDDCEAHEARAKANTAHEKLCAWLESASTPFPINGTERSRDP